ncbi:nuclear transport factor 2 family protein [Candidatus Macondimonas diazotrophica]|jgi:4-oxalocrotonate tautomerase|uniref:Nuclear transport factor 2 family protein n=1 Tax=Candidatus Macondimonas diazotrophica TaxID=2305248 RepID=A0A4Z0F8Y1_9GAMM|nr:nuclear transport factor 2 family protein [Candidatus Macondimonas diazotrophica]NCU01155.1 nuclear transport factor 2 family protein [Candidatus Macondimonas diazotrophica]TFZ82278.1 nuclear transport factor 2 family protein [Candidatus Macondimonas diazotrophica]HBG31229.1 nuclear transport factor 2 family protein [Gammaproteobacteria bacterium]HBG50453.1 nuclear transport factor 2 family protein [Gammaproteobacteria bacterium]
MSGTESLRGQADLAAIASLVRAYCKGLHQGDPALLRSLFDPQAALQAPGLRRSLDAWLAMVARRSSPAVREDPFAYGILGIDLMGDQALAKVDCPLLGDRFTDCLSLLREDGQWRIVNKMYAPRA